MPHFDSPTVQYLFYILSAVAVVLLLWIGFRVGRWAGNLASAKLIASKEQELFTAQKGFKSVYDQEINQLRQENTSLSEQVKTLTGRVEDYRKKAAGLGGLFSSSSKKSDAMYALLLENEALEEALYAQNEKLRDERTDALKEQMRATGYRRVLMSQLLNDERIKGYVAEVLSDERALPKIEAAPQLPGGQDHHD